MADTFDWSSLDEPVQPPISGAPDWDIIDKTIASEQGGAPLETPRSLTIRPYLQEASKNEANQYGWAGPAGNALASFAAANPAEHVPVVSPLISAATKGAGALFGAGAGDTFGERYADLSNREEARKAVSEARHPIANLVGELGTAPLMPTFGAENIGTYAAGRIASSQLGEGIASGAGRVAGDIASGMGLSGLYGAAKGAETGDTLSEQAQNALTGGKQAATAGVDILGYHVPFAAALPVIGKAIEGGASALTSKVGADPEAERLRAALLGDVKTKADLQGINPRSPALGMGTEDIAAAQQAGQPWMIGDIGGEQTRTLARSIANISPEAETTLKTPLEGRFADQASRFSDFFTGLFGPGQTDALKVKDQLAARARVENNANYTSAYSQPNAQAMWNDDLARLMQSSSMQSAIGDAERIGKDVAASSGTKAVQNPFVKDADGNWTLHQNPDGSVAIPNLQFWDQVKQAMDDKVQTAYSSVGGKAAGAIKDVRDTLKNVLDTAVPEYGAARAGAAAHFGADNMVDAGTSFMKNMNAYDTSSAKKALASATPAERELFGMGMAADITNRAAQTGDATNIARLFNTPQSREKLLLGLGPQRAQQVESYLRRESMMNMLRTSVGGNSNSVAQLLAASALLGHEIWNNKEEFLNNPLTATAGIGASIAAIALSKYNKGIDRELAPKIARLMTSSSPADIARLNMATQRSSTVRNAIRQAEMGMAANYGRMSQGTNPNAPYVPPKPDREARASGGKVTGHGHLVSRLMRLAEQAKKLTNEDTKPLLNVPDETVAKALSTAQNAI